MHGPGDRRTALRRAGTGRRSTRSRANAAGNYNKTFKTKTFPISIAQGDTGFVYYVNVHLADGTVIACGKFRGSKKATPKFKKQQAAKRKKGKGEGPQALSRAAP